MMLSLRSLRVVIGVAGIALVSGCGTNNNYMPPRTGYIDPPPQATASLTSLSYRVELGRGQTALTRAQIDGLNRFLAANGETDGDHIEIRTMLAGGPVRNAAVADTLRGSFIAGGYTPSRVEIIQVPGSGDVIEVVIQRYTVVLPDCSHEISRDNGIMEWSDEPVNLRKMGCSNASNLGLMVADPRDLANVRELAPSPGYRETGAVLRYRTDKVKELETFKTTEGGSK